MTVEDSQIEVAVSYNFF